VKFYNWFFRIYIEVIFKEHFLEKFSKESYCPHWVRTNKLHFYIRVLRLTLGKFEFKIGRIIDKTSRAQLHQQDLRGSGEGGGLRRGQLGGGEAPARGQARENSSRQGNPSYKMKTVSHLQNSAI
jgi:hypothetical protein